jgi:hypothetical protein
VAVGAADTTWVVLLLVVSAAHWRSVVALPAGVGSNFLIKRRPATVLAR